MAHAGFELIVFDVPAADGPVMVEGDGFPLRMGDRTVAASESQIQALKLRGLVESWESRPSRLRLGDLDVGLLERARRGAGLIALSDEEYLLKRKLADRRGRDIVLRRGAELLFAKDGPDHPNAGIRLFRVVGTERRLGAEHNVEERPRFEGNVPAMLRDAFAAIDGIIRRPARLVGTHFRTVPEYPEFSWKEGVLNAVAHRDYNVEGRTTEIWFFDDRVEITSPGGLVPDVSLDELLTLQRTHVSRNPRSVRGLVDLGLMRDQGEGIPRMFAEMEGLFLPAPLLEPSAREFRLTLRNTPTLTAADRTFVAQLGNVELSDQEFRALLECHRAGRVDNARLRAISGLDTLGASALLRKLRDRGLLQLHAAGAASFYELGPQARQTPNNETGGFDSQTGGFDPQTGGLDPQTGGLGEPMETEATSVADLIAMLPPGLKEAIEGLGGKPAPSALRKVIVELCEHRFWTPRELALVLHRKDVAHLSEKHLAPLVKANALERKYPDNPAHPQQAYRARQSRLPTGGVQPTSPEGAPPSAGRGRGRRP
ncbi:MAG: ATP-binding protein [Byssovorax sp.]